MAAATWVPVTYLPAQADQVLPALLAAGALEVQTNVRPKGPRDPDPLLWPHRMEVDMTMSVLWPDDLEETPNDVTRRCGGGGW